MKIFDWFRSKKSTQKNIAATVSISAPEGWPGGPRYARPKKRGKSIEQYNSEYNEYFLKVESRKKAMAHFNRERATRAGVTHYIWKSTKTNNCIICKKRTEKKYSYSKPTSDGYPGEGKCGSGDFCHARAHPIVKL